MFVSISIYVCNHYFALIPFASSLRTCTSLLLSRSDFDIFLSNNSFSVDPAGAFSKYLRCQMKDGRKFYLLDLCLSDLRESRYQTPKNIDFFSRLAIGSKIFGSLGVPNGHNGCNIHLFILYNFSFPGHNLIFKLFQRLIFVVDKTFFCFDAVAVAEWNRNQLPSVWSFDTFKFRAAPLLLSIQLRNQRQQVHLLCLSVTDKIKYHMCTQCYFASMWTTILKITTILECAPSVILSKCQ
jgi:hypothetical protein